MYGILCEKPSAARNFAKALGGGRGVFEGDEFAIASARGHLFELCPPERQVDASLAGKYRDWSVGLLPWNVDEIAFRRELRRGGKETFDAVKGVLCGCSDVVIATDDDPSGEGDLLAWEILIEAGIASDPSVTVWRLRHGDETVEEIRRAWRAKVREPLEASGAYRKAFYRQRFDFLSMQFTRAATGLFDGRTMLRQGRLKSAMVALVGDQEAAWRDWKRVPFFAQRYRDEHGNVFACEDARRYASAAECEQGETGWGRACTVEETGVEAKRRRPPKLMDLATLSALLAKTTGMGAKDVLSVYQKMYEAHVVSYPRTEDTKITRGQFGELLPHADRIAATVGVDPGVLTHRVARSSHVGEGLAHGANRPGTVVPDSLASLDERFGAGAADIYRVLALSFLRLLAEDEGFEMRHARLVERPDFVSKLRVRTVPGWTALAIEGEDGDDGGDGEGNAGRFGGTALPFVHEGAPKRPPHPTMAWLMTQLEKRNVGTGATRTSTYSQMVEDRKEHRLIQAGKGGRCSLTETGWHSRAMIRETCIGDLRLTEAVQRQMAAIADGTLDPERALASVAGLVAADIRRMEANGVELRRSEGIGMRARPAGPDDFFEGVWNGQEVRIKRLWGTHRFTDDECGRLLAGETVEFPATSKNGNTYTAAASIQKFTYKRERHVGVRSVDRVPETWSGHAFTGEERARLEAGETVEIYGAVGRSGKRFNAAVEYKNGKINVANWL